MTPYQAYCLEAESRTKAFFVEVAGTLLLWWNAASWPRTTHFLFWAFVVLTAWDGLGCVYSIFTTLRTAREWRQAEETRVEVQWLYGTLVVRWLSFGVASGLLWFLNAKLHVV